VQQVSGGGLDNVLVIKSLSKSLGVPGLRVGALVTSDETMAGRIREATPIWNLSSTAEHFLEIMLKHRVPLERSFRRTAADRDMLTQELKASSLVHTVLPSAANFLLVRLTVSAAGADAGARWLVEHRAVLVKDVSTKMADGGGWWRLAVRDAHDIGVLVQAMRDLYTHGLVPWPASGASLAPQGST
jgi:histidinol-phosphate/aromatic aminotransferase/cobyric acid decarboxylase-like protein